MKDFLFLSYSVHQCNYLFRSFLDEGYTGDIINESSVHDFQLSEPYKVVVLYLHEADTIEVTNRIICQLPSAFVIQHDDTDCEDVNIHWSPRPPDLIMQRELTNATKNPFACPIYPMHFPMASIYAEEYQDKHIDVCFLANTNHSRRLPFIERVSELMREMPNLNWHVRILNGGTSPEYREVVNKSKIGLHYFGNSYDSSRIWELASAKTAIIMPQLRLKSTSKDWMPFENYVRMRDDFSDIKEQITSTLKGDKWQEVGEAAYRDYNLNHTQRKCFERYRSVIENHVRF